MSVSSRTSNARAAPGTPRIRAHAPSIAETRTDLGLRVARTLEGEGLGELVVVAVGHAPDVSHHRADLRDIEILHGALGDDDDLTAADREGRPDEVGRVGLEQEAKEEGLTVARRHEHDRRYNADPAFGERSASGMDGDEDPRAAAPQRESHLALSFGPAGARVDAERGDGLLDERHRALDVRVGVIYQSVALLRPDLGRRNATCQAARALDSRRGAHQGALIEGLAKRLERLVAELSEPDGGSELDRARAEFHARTGEFSVGENWYEERIRAFFDWFLCDHRDAEGLSLAARWLAQNPNSTDEAALVARACTRASRSLYAVDATAGSTRVDDLLGGGRFALVGTRLRHGDIFDGRLLVLGDLVLMPGIVFHPPQTHEALRELLSEIGAPIESEREPVLDGLLRMRMRLDRFTSIRAQHIYQAEALADVDILSAAWARRADVPDT